MNNTFNLQRFGWLLRKTVVERPFQIVGIIGLSLAASLFAYIIVKMLAGYEDAQNISFFLGLAVGGCLLSANMFNYFSTNAAGSSFLTFPASNFEKWLCAVIISGVIFVSLFLVFYHLMDIAFVNSYHQSLDASDPFYKDRFDAVKAFKFDSFMADKTFMLFFNAAGGMLIGALYFNKAALIKSLLLFLGIWFGGFLINVLIAGLFIKNIQNAFPYYLVWIWVGKERVRLELPENIQNIVSIIFHYILPAILWSLAYLRLREKEF